MLVELNGNEVSQKEKPLAWYGLTREQSFNIQNVIYSEYKHMQMSPKVALVSFEEEKDFLLRKALVELGLYHSFILRDINVPMRPLTSPRMKTERPFRTPGVIEYSSPAYTKRPEHGTVEYLVHTVPTAEGRFTQEPTGMFVFCQDWLLSDYFNNHLGKVISRVNDVIKDSGNPIARIPGFVSAEGLPIL